MMYEKFSNYIDVSIEDFTKHINSLSYQELVNLKKSFELQFQKTVFMKDLILEKIEKKEVTLEESQETLNELYKLMFIIEERAKLVEFCRKEILGNVEN